MEFNDVCEQVRKHLAQEWKNRGERERAEFLEFEKRAIMGYEDDMDSYIEIIRNIIRETIEGTDKEEKRICPDWYPELAWGVFHQLYGLAGVAPWAYDTDPKYKMSSSAKLIGDRLYCLIDGKSVLQPQRINKARREQLKRALLLSSPRERLETGYHEVYLRNGIRITIFGGEKTKDEQDVMIFRKYIVDNLSFKQLADLGTIPSDSIELFERMIEIGFNIIIAGPVRSGKTTFLRVWQKQEIKELEGLCISTDPETPWHKIMPDSPLMQLVADGRELENITKSIVRGDNDYVILEEMRDAAAFNIALEIMGTGTHRSKFTVHTSDVTGLPFKMASKIYGRYGGSFKGILQQIFTCYDYIFEFCQCEMNRAEKRLKAIWEYCYDGSSDTAEIHKICEFDFEKECWKWNKHIGKDKVEKGKLRPEAFKEMEEKMKKLEANMPIKKPAVIYPRYYVRTMDDKVVFSQNEGSCI